MEPRRRERKRKLSDFLSLFYFFDIFSPLYFVVTFAYIEVVFHVTEFKNASSLFPVLFAIPSGLFAGFFCNLFPEKVSRVLRYVISAAFMVLFGVQIVYFHSFQSFMSLTQVGMGDDVFTNFFKTIVLAVWESLIPILLLFLPLVGLFFLHKAISKDRKFNWKKSLLSGMISLVTYILVILSLPLGGKGDHSAWANFHNNWVLDLSMEKLGVMTTTGIDLRTWLFSSNADGATDPEVPTVVTEPDFLQNETEPVITNPNKPTEPVDPEVPTEPPSPEDLYNFIPGMDYAALAESASDAKIKGVFQYLASQEPTNKNDFTGMFAGYNLILISAESFSPMGIHPELTPTLYMMANSGLDFTNYWTMYPSNTTNGEYSNLTGLIPDISKPKQDGSFVYSVKNTMNMNIAHWFNAQGATSRAYHNHTATYYKRNKTHPNLGYSVFKGKNEIGGLSGWPESDLVMMQKTVGEYINDDWFHTYYMTVSGHHNYRFGYNTVADKNKSLVAGLDMKEPARAYLATHIELDRALEHLISELEKAGKLDKTVIVITTDHYPYGLTDAEYRDMLGHELGYGGNERYKSELIIWNSAIERVQVDKPCCQVDVLPTLLNLFGFTYDSRLYSGMDVFSNNYGLAMMANQSFVTDKIVYNSRTEKVYYLDPDWTMPEGYLDYFIGIVKNRFSIASNILNRDFYGKLPQDVVAKAHKGEK